MIDDPIVDEVHQARAKMLAECDGDIELLMDRLKANEPKNATRLVSSADEARQRPAKAKSHAA